MGRSQPEPCVCGHGRPAQRQDQNEPKHLIMPGDPRAQIVEDTDEVVPDGCIVAFQPRLLSIDLRFEGGERVLLITDRQP